MENRIRSEREQRGWTQVVLAERLGVSRQTIVALETGEVRSLPPTGVSHLPSLREEHRRSLLSDDQQLNEHESGSRRKGWVGLGRGAWIAPGPFPQAALRTGRAILTASGSPRGQAVGLMTVTGHGVGIRLPRQR